MARAFNWTVFFSSHRIEYFTSGRNTGLGHVSTKCPMCRDDPSNHMSVNTANGYWKCWRDPAHKGKSPVRLIAAYLKCSYREAALIAGVRQPGDFQPNRFDDLKSGVVDEERSAPHEIQFPSFVQPLWEASSSIAEPFFDYLRDRGFSKPRACAREFELRYSMKAKWRWRIVFPIHWEDKLVSFTGRTVADNDPIRYRTLSEADDNMPKPGLASKELLYTCLHQPAEQLLVVEGPFDALKLAYVAVQEDIPVGVVSTMTVSFNKEKTYRIRELAPLYKGIGIIYDNSAYGQAEALRKELIDLRPQVHRLPDGFEDPGSLTYKEAARLLEVAHSG